VLATGSYPDAPAASIGYSDEARYRAMATRFGPIADQSLVCGCHVHVAVPDRAVAVAVIDQVRLWIAPLIALSANSPLWQGVDTGFDSWRTQVWSRWPTAGPASAFGSVDQYDRVADALVCSGAAIDRAGIYYQARVSESWPTIEVRVADVCLDVEDAVLLGLLVRALVIRAFVDIEQKATSDVPPELLRAATFAASRWGLRESLVDPTDWRRHRAGEVLQRLVSHIRAPLEECGDLERAQGGIDRLLNGATAAEKQRRVWQQGGTQAVLDLITLGWPPTL
jgi:carboxylate-amine ligase